MLQVEFLTVTGQDSTRTRSVGTFVSHTVDRVVKKTVLATMCWGGTSKKAAFGALEHVVEAIKRENYNNMCIRTTKTPAECYLVSILQALLNKVTVFRDKRRTSLF